MSRLTLVLVCLLPYCTMVHLEDTLDEMELPDDTPRIFLFVFTGLAIAGILRALVKVLNFPIPFRVLIIFVGGIVGALSSYIVDMGKYIEIVEMNPRFILMAFLPVIVFKTAFCIDAHTFMRSWSQIFFLAVPGLLISACFTGLIMMVILGHDDWTYSMGILFGTLCSSIYPVEIVEMLKGVGQAKHLAILLEGEGMVGDNTVMIIYQILLGQIDGYIEKWYRGVMVFVRFACGGILLGLVCGKILTWIMGALYNDVVNMLISTIISAYLTYYIGVEILSVSGIIAVVVVGVMASMEKTSLAVDVEIFLLHFWDMLAYVANTMVFLLAGIMIAERLSNYTTLKDCILVLVTYVVASVARLIAYILMAPIVSRIGYGLTFKKMTIAVWSGVRGPVPFCLTLNVFHHVGLSPLGRELLVHVAGLVTLTLLVNATSMPVLLRLLGLSELSMARKVNMNNCMRHLQNRRDRTISMLKMDRFLADANWPIVNTATILKHPYKINFSDSDDEEENYLGYRTTTCPDCLKEIPNEPTNKEMIEMTREARTRILKAKKISYARQYENGMLSKDGIRVLTQAVETAMDTDEAIIELEGLHKYFRRQGFVQYTRRRLLAVFFKKSENTVKPPRKYWRRICYHIVMHPAFDVFIYFCIVLNVIPIGLEIGLAPKPGSNFSTGIKIANTIFFVIYLFEFILKIYGYSWIYICKHGFKTYFGSYWNVFDFFILCVALVDLVMDYIELFSKDFDKQQHRASRVTLVTKLIRVVRLIRLLRLCKAWYPKIIKYCDSRIDKHLAFAYDVGKGFVTGEEEVSDMLIQMIDNKIIREDCRLRMEADRLAITKELGMVQKDRPWIAITVKTRQAIRATLNNMGDSILELKVSGWVDDVEYAMLMESLEERLKYVRTKVTSVQPSPPKVMFKEVPWMADNEQIADFLYENVVTKVFDQGDVVCVDGEMADGVYIIVTGLFKLSYIPKKEVLDGLVEYGALPIIDYIASTRFDEKVEDYIVSGNCVGELSALTGRPYNCTITADTASQAYILTHDVIKQAVQRSPDPINGLESRMWKSLSIRLATSILMDTPAYQSSTQEKIRFQLERAFVPNLSNYKVFGVNDMMEDIMLIEGVVFDYNTRDCYTAPCYIPRTVQKIVLPKSSHMDFQTTVETKLLIIPAKDVDEFDIMEREEEMSEMISTGSAKCIQHLIQDRGSRSRRRRKRQTTFSMGGRRVKYGGSHMSTSQSVYYSRSRTTNGSSVETELQDINMYDHTSMGGTTVDSYVINEKENKPLLPDRRISRGLSGERKIPSRRASSIASKRPLKEITNKEEPRFSKVVEAPIGPRDETENLDNKLEVAPVPEDKKEKEEKPSDLNEHKDDISERKLSSGSRKVVQLSIDQNTADQGSPSTLPKLEEPKRKGSDDQKRENVESVNLNSPTGKENQNRPTDTKSANKPEDVSPERRRTTISEDLSQTQPASNALKNQRQSLAQTSDDIEQIEVEQRSEIFTGIKEEKAYRNKSPDNTEKLFKDDAKSEPPRSDNRKTSADYNNYGRDEVKAEDQRRASTRIQPENAEKDDMKPSKRLEDSEPRRAPEARPADRRKSVAEDLKRSENDEGMKQRRQSDDSETKDEQMVTPKDNRETSQDYNYEREEVKGEDQRRASTRIQPKNAEKDDMKPSKRLEDIEPRSAPEARPADRRKSVAEHLKRADNDEGMKQRRQSDDSETIAEQMVTPKDNRKTSQDYNYGREEVKGEDQRRASTRIQPENAEKDDMKPSKRLEDIEPRRASEAQSADRRKSVAEHLKRADNDEGMKQRRQSDDSETKDEQMVTPKERKTSQDYNYGREEVKGEDQRRASTRIQPENAEKDDMKPSKRLEDSEPRRAPEARPADRRKSVAEYLKSSDNDEDMKQRRQSDDSETIAEQMVTPKDNRKTSQDYNYGREEVKGEDQRRASTRIQPENAEKDDMKPSKRLEDIEPRRAPEARPADRRKSVAEHLKRADNDEGMKQRRQSDDSETKDEQMATPKDNRKTSQDYNYGREEVKGEDQRRASIRSSAIQPENAEKDDRKQPKRLEDSEPRRASEAQSADRRKSVAEHLKRAENDEGIKQGRESDDSATKEETSARRQSDIRPSNENAEPPPFDNRKTSKDYNYGKPEVKGEDQRRASTRSSAIQPENDDIKQPKRIEEPRRDSEAQTAFRRKSNAIEDVKQRRQSDDSETKEEQMIASKAETSGRRQSELPSSDNRKTSRDYNYGRPETKEVDQRRASTRSSAIQPENDDIKQPKRLEDSRRTSEAQTAFRRKSSAEYSNIFEDKEDVKQRRQSADSETKEEQKAEISARRQSVIRPSNENAEPPSSDNRKTSRDYNYGRPETKGEEQRSSFSQPDNAAKDDIKQQKRLEDKRPSEAQTEFRRKSSAEYSKMSENNEDMKQRRQSSYEPRGAPTNTTKTEPSASEPSSDKADNPSQSQASDDQTSYADKFQVESSLTQLRRKSLTKNVMDRKFSTVPEANENQSDATEMESLRSEDQRSYKEDMKQRRKSRDVRKDYEELQDSKESEDEDDENTS